VQTLQQREVDAAVKLHGTEAGLLRLLRDLFCGQRGEDAYAFDVGGKMRGDLCDLLRRYLALAGREDEADCNRHPTVRRAAHRRDLCWRRS